MHFTILITFKYFLSLGPPSPIFLMKEAGEKLGSHFRIGIPTMNDIAPYESLICLIQYQRTVCKSGIHPEVESFSNVDKHVF